MGSRESLACSRPVRFGETFPVELPPVPENMLIWDRQHPGLDVDEQKDYASHNDPYTIRLLKALRIGVVYLAGLHVNACITTLARWMLGNGIRPVLIKGASDTLHVASLDYASAHDAACEHFRKTYGGVVESLVP